MKPKQQTNKSSDRIMLIFQCLNGMVSFWVVSITGNWALLYGLDFEFHTHHIMPINLNLKTQKLTMRCALYEKMHLAS